MLLKICKLSLFISVIYSSLYQNFCFAAQDTPNDAGLEWRLSFRSVETIPFNEEFDWEKYLSFGWNERESPTESLSDYQSSLIEGLSEKFINQITDLLFPLSNQLGSLSDDIVTQVINILFSVETSLRENFIKNVIEKEIFHPSHPLHQRTYDLDRAINYLGSLALTFTRGGSSRISFLDNTSPIPPAIQQIISVW